jgi:hypothetical protein
MSPDIAKMPGIKARDLSRSITGRGIAQDGPVFYRVTVETCCLNGQAIQRQAGLEMIIGNAAIAQVMGPDEDMAKIIDTKTVFVTVTEALTIPVAALIDGE